MSDAVKAVRYLLANNGSLTAVVPATRIRAGVLPQGTDLPAISITLVSAVRRNPIAAPASHFYTARVQVSILAAKYTTDSGIPGLANIKTLVRAALPRSRGTVNGVAVDSILFDTEGPDFTGDEAMHIGSLDFTVFYTAT